MIYTSSNVPIHQHHQPLIWHLQPKLPVQALQCCAYSFALPFPLLFFPSLCPSQRGSSQIFDDLCSLSNLWDRLFSTHAAHRPQASLCLISPSSTTTTISALPTGPPVDLLPKISFHPSLASIQVRNGPRDTFNPSHRVRKRRHGFLSRLRTRTGRMMLKRRRLKGRSTLSH